MEEMSIMERMKNNTKVFGRFILSPVYSTTNYFFEFSFNGRIPNSKFNFSFLNIPIIKIKYQY